MKFTYNKMHRFQVYNVMGFDTMHYVTTGPIKIQNILTILKSSLGPLLRQYPTPGKHFLISITIA